MACQALHSSLYLLLLRLASSVDFPALSSPSTVTVTSLQDNHSGNNYIPYQIAFPPCSPLGLQLMAGRKTVSHVSILQRGVLRMIKITGCLCIAAIVP